MPPRKVMLAGGFVRGLVRRDETVARGLSTFPRAYKGLPDLAYPFFDSHRGHRLQQNLSGPKKKYAQRGLRWASR